LGESGIRLEAGASPAEVKTDVVRWIVAGLTVVLLLALGAKVAMSTYYVWEMFRFPFQIDDSEGVILSGAQWLSQGVSIYTPVRPDLFISAPYTPIYYVLNALAIGVMGVTFKAGRALSLLSAVLAGVMIYRIVLHETRNRLAALVGVGTFGGMSLVAVWAVRVKPDLMGVALSLTGVYLALEWSGSAGKGRGWLKGSWLIYASAVVLVLAFYTKQTLLAAPLAVFIWLLVSHRWLAAKFAAVYLGCVGVAFLALNLSSGGGFFEDVVGFHGHFALVHYLDMWGEFAQSYWPLLLLTVAFIAVSVWWRRSRLIAIYALAAFVFAAQVGTYGGSHNHFLEVAAVFSLSAAVLFGLAQEKARGWRWSGALTTLGVLGFLAVSSFQTPGWLAWEYRAPTTSQWEGLQNVASYVTNYPGEVFSDNIGILLVAGKPVRYTDPYTMMDAARRGTWDESGLVREIEQKKFSLIVLWTNVEVDGNKPWDISQAVYEAIRQNYQIDQKNVLFIYRPKATQS
jgi:hypothetical protein